MLKVKILKSGKFGLHHAWGGTVMFKEGDEYTEGDKLKDINGKKKNANGELNVMSREVARRMEDAGWAELTDTKLEEDPPELEKGPISALEELLKDVKDEKGQKSIIQDWAALNYGIKPSASKKVENMIMEIEDHIANNEDTDPE